MRATDRSELDRFEIAADLGWGTLLAGPFQVADAMGDHLGVLRAPETAALIQRELTLWVPAQPTLRQAQRESRLSITP